MSWNYYGNDVDFTDTLQGSQGLPGVDDLTAAGVIFLSVITIH